VLSPLYSFQKNKFTFWGSKFRIRELLKGEEREEGRDRLKETPQEASTVDSVHFLNMVCI
jgi:hypothetical protein